MASMGHFIFHDAMYIPQSLENDKVLAIDVITPHQFEYYKNSGSAWPNDYDNPVPVQFLNVKPGARFLVAISGETGWAQFVVARLKEALAEWGIGGKTSSGYGRVERQWRQVVDPSRARIYTSQLISDFKEWKKNNNFQQRDFFKEIVSQWLPRFSNATTEEKKALNEIINTDYPDKKIKREEIRDLKLQVLNSLLN
jgi:CRISPR-associated protein Cmr6